jgi:hypothetical protein
MSSKVPEPASLQVEYAAVGGKKTKKSQQSKQQDKKKQAEPKKKQSQSAKKGGAIVNDVKNLAVPFAILLAKEGLSKMFKADTKTTKSSKSLSASSAKKTTSSRRRTTMSGGSCNLGCTAQTGGQAAKQLFELQTEIDRFLEKY